MSFLRMSSVGVLPAEQKLKRGEVLLQYTRVLAPPEYTPIPFNKQQVKTLKADLSWTFTKLLKKILKHDGNAAVPLHIGELLWEVQAAEKRHQAEIERLKKEFKDRFTGVKGLSRFGHEQAKAVMFEEADEDAEAEAEQQERLNESDYATETEAEQTENEAEQEEEEAYDGDEPPPPPPGPPEQPAPPADEDGEEPGGQQPGSPAQDEHAAAQGQQQVFVEQQLADQDEQQMQEEMVDEDDVEPVQEQAAAEPDAEAADEENAAAAEAKAQAEEVQAEQQFEDAAPADDAQEPEQQQEDDAAVASPVSDGAGIGPAHHVIAAMDPSGGDQSSAGLARRQSALRASRQPSRDLASDEQQQPPDHERRRSWVRDASVPQHEMAAAMNARRASLEGGAAAKSRRASGEVPAVAAEEQPTEDAATEEAAVEEQQQQEEQQEEEQKQERSLSAARRRQLEPAAQDEKEDEAAAEAQAEDDAAVDAAPPSADLDLASPDAAAASSAAASSEQQPSHLLGTGDPAADFLDFDAIRAGQKENPDGGFLHKKSGRGIVAAEVDDGTTPTIVSGSVLVAEDLEEDDPALVAARAKAAAELEESQVEREPPRPYGFLPFVKISRNGFTKEVRIPMFGDKYIDPPLGWLREKYRFAAPSGVHAFVTLHAYGYVIYAKNNIKF